MAGEVVAPSLNGVYGSQPLYAVTEAPNQGSSGTAVNGQGHATTASTTSESATPSKDEVGWYFVEQYYTTLSKSPEKLHLFYAKRSQFVSGVEAEKVSVSVGQRAIGERIKEMDIQDCKVRVTNVDSQESGRDIVVQVIGEMSNKSAPHRKFVQTFVLAEQPNGYFVLNDIFRYIAEEEEDEMAAPVAPEPETVDAPAQEIEPHTLTSSNDLIALEKDASIVDKKLEQTTAESKDQPDIESTTVDETPVAEPETVEETHEEESPVQTTTTEAVQEAEKLVAEESTEPEAPKDPEPTPAPGSPKHSKATPIQAQTQEPTASYKPAAPKTWASMLASNKTPTPAVPNVPSSTSTPQQPKSTSQAGPAPVSTTSATADESQGPTNPGGWQTAGQDSGRKQGRQQSGSVSGGTNEKTTVHGYIKNVTERVDASLLKNALAKFGKLEYFDVSRPKNCAFIEYADIATLNAAMAASPLHIGGEDIYVEERRPRANAYGGGFNARGGMRGGRGGLDGRTPSQGGRGNYPKDGRGGFVPRGRGGNMTPRGGRGMPQAA